MHTLHLNICIRNTGVSVNCHQTFYTISIH